MEAITHLCCKEMARYRNNICNGPGTEEALNKWQLLCLIKNCFKFFPGLFSTGGPEKHPLLVGLGTKVPNIYKILVTCLELWRGEPQRLRGGPALPVFTARGRRALAQVCAFRFSFRVSPAALADARGAGGRAGTARSSGGPGVRRRRPGAPGG